MGGLSQAAVTPKLKVREATYADLPRLVQLGHQFWKHSPYEGIADFNEESLLSYGAALIEEDRSVIFTNGRGMIGGTLMPLYFGQTLVAQEIFWYAQEGGKELLDAFEQWAKDQGASQVAVSSFAGETRMHKLIETLYKRRKYKATETQYLKEI